MNKNNIKGIIIVILISATIFSIYLAIKSITDRLSDKNDAEYLKNYEANEYIPVYVSDETMAKIYLSDYTNNLYFDIEKAYNLLNSEYREKKFGSLDSFQNYVNSLDLNTLEIKSFATKNSGGYEYFYIYDTSDRLYVFKTKGVMQYEVYLDDTTVDV